MTDTTVSRVPQKIDLELYAGDGAALKFTLTDLDDNPFSLNGVVTSQIKAKRSDSTPKLSWSIDDSQFSEGICIISLTGDQTASLIANGRNFRGVWDLQYIESGAEPVTFVQGRIKCDADVTR